jgi:hypothetical protein
MTALMKALGGDVGEDADIASTNIRNIGGVQIRGLEHRQLLELCLSWQVHFQPVLRHGESRHNRNLSGLLAADDMDIARRVQGDVARVAAGLPDVVKCPAMMRWLNLWLLAGGPKPGHVFIMVRDTLDQALSNQRDGFTPNSILPDMLDTQADYGFLLQTVMEHHITFSLLPFPECVKEPYTLIAALGIAGEEAQAEFTRVWRTVAKAGDIKTTNQLTFRAQHAEEHPFPQGRLMVAEMTRGVIKEDSDDGTESTFSIPPLHLA